MTTTSATAGPIDQALVRRRHLSQVLRTAARPGPWSRARIAAETGLTRATVSSLVADLINRRLLREGAVERGGLGRPGQLLALDPDHVAFLGVEINVDYLACHVLDLSGAVIASRTVALDVRQLDPTATMRRVGKLVNSLVASLGDRPVQSLHLAIPGMIETTVGRVAYAPNLQWRNVDAVTMLAAEVKLPATRIAADNEANLAALAEYAAGSAAGTTDLVLVTGEVGVGGGVISGGGLMRGARGYSGEFGHMALADASYLCGCGRRGCWEAAIGLDAILARVSDPGDPLRDVTQDLPTRLAEVVARADRGDRRTLDGLREVGLLIGRGAAALVNAFNPEVLMFGGTFAALATHVEAPITEALTAHAIAPEAGGCRIAFSTLGFNAAGIGGAQVGIEWVLDNPTSVAPFRPLMGGRR